MTDPRLRDAGTPQRCLSCGADYQAPGRGCDECWDHKPDAGRTPDREAETKRLAEMRKRWQQYRDIGSVSWDAYADVMYLLDSLDRERRATQQMREEIQNLNARLRRVDWGAVAPPGGQQPTGGVDEA
jgi:hypothetical protein